MKLTLAEWLAVNRGVLADPNNRLVILDAMGFEARELPADRNPIRHVPGWIVSPLNERDET